MKLILLFALFLICSVNKGLAWSIELINKETNKPRVNLVFCSLHYPDKQDFSQDIAILIERLKKTRPFDENMAALRIWRVNMVSKEEKEIFKDKEGFPPLAVRQDFLDGITNRLKSNFKLIIIDARGSVSCAELSSSDKLSLVILGRARYANAQSFAKGFLHELGHSLGLRDECVDCGQLCPAGPPNCATTKEEAKMWWGDMVGKVERVNYIHGCCGNLGYLRPVIASLMNDTEKAEDFGPVNERFLREELRR